MQQSSPPLAALPGCLLLAVVASVAPVHAHAQDRYRVTRQENFRREAGPTAGLLASVNVGTEMVGGVTREGWVEVTLEGWIWAQSLRSLSGPEYDWVVNARSGENLRAEPDGTILARLINGFWLKEIEDRGNWIRVERTGWMWGRSLEVAQVAGPADQPEPSGDGPQPEGSSGSQRSDDDESPPSPPPPAEGLPTPSRSDGAAGVSDMDRAVTIGRSTLRRLPDGDTTAILGPDSPVRILARSGEWVRVRAEGWLHESDLRPASGDVLVGVSGAEVRARPSDFAGRVLQWTVQLLAVQTSVGLRREMPEGQQYMLARGPLPEAGTVYVLLADEQVEEVARLSPLAQLVVLVRVRGRDEYLGNPIVELVQMSLRKP